MALELMEDEVPEAVTSWQDAYPEGSIRLAEISVFNWGTFSGLHTGAIDPQGTLVSGHTGAGKSTFIDALQPLLLPPRYTRFNTAAAQAEEKDRSMVTYIRGRLGSISDGNGRSTGKYKRTGETLSGIRALYRTERSNEITLAALFWMGADGSALGDVSRGYLVASGNYSLKTFLDAIRHREKGSIRWDNLSSQYKGRKDITVTQSFDAYAAAYRKHLWMPDEKAPALLARAMGLKRINDLTTMVRELVLEEPDTRDMGLQAIKEFSDLKAIHGELVGARLQHEALKLLPDRAEQRDREIKSRDQLQKLVNVLPAWHSARAIELLEEVIGDDRRQVQSLEKRQVELNKEVSDLQDELGKAIARYEAAGGANLDALETNLEREKDVLAQREANCTALHGVLQKLKIPAPDEGWTESELSDLKNQLQKDIDATGDQIEELKARQLGVLVQKEKLEEQSQGLKEELAELSKRKDSNIHSDYLRMRRLLADDTGILLGELPFLGELIDVKDTESVWRGAIERALGFERHKLIVSPQRRSEVRDYFDRTKFRMKVGFEVTSNNAGPATFRPDSYLRKLVWGDHPARDWLKRYLVDHHSLDCVARDQMEGRPYCMTVNGLVQYRVGSYIKDDTRDIHDPLHWHLGFNNEARKAALAGKLTGLLQQQQNQINDAADLGRQIRAKEAFGEEAKAVMQFDWASINFMASRAAVKSLEVAIEKLKRSERDLTTANLWVLQCKSNCNTANEMAQKAAAATELAKQALNRHESKVSGLRPRASQILDEAAAEELAARCRLHPMRKDDIERIDEIEGDRKAALQTDLDKARSAVSGSERFLTNVMAEYRGKFGDKVNDLLNPQRADDNETFSRIVRDWLKHFTDLVEGRLPDLVDRFQKSLNHQTTQSLSMIRQAIDAQRSEITDRIEQINSILEQTEIKDGTHLSLLATPLVLEPVQRFDDHLKAAIRLAAGSDPEAHFDALQALIKLLERATDSQTRFNQDTQCQLDARYRMAFSVREWRPPPGKTYTCPFADRQTVYDHADTTGASGGEKEGFSGFVVASALAYVLTPRGARKPSYCTVWLDEAFSNTSDGYAKRVLKVFRELGIHLNLITPFKNVELARSAVRSAVVVEKDSENDSFLSEVTWEEIDRQRLAAAAEDDPLLTEARRLNVSYEAAG